VSEIEENIYQKNYQGEDIYKRLARLENELYGSIKNEQSLQERVENLKSTLPPKQNSRFTAKNLGFRDFGLTPPQDYSVSTSSDSDIVVRELELETFNRSFDNESTKKRIERLENYYFGGISMGQTEEDRVMKLASVVMNSKNMQNYFPQPKGSQWAGILMNLLVFGLGFLL